MSEGLRPRQLVHRGVVDAAAFFVAREPSELRARERIVPLAATSEVHRLPDGWIVRLRTPRSIACVGAPGAPLVGYGKGKRMLSSAPLDEDELESLGSTLRETFVLVRGGEAVIAAPSGLEDPSEWLELSGFAIAEVETLGVVPPPPVAMLTPVREVRQVLGGPAATPELAAVIAALRKRAAAQAGAPGAAGPNPAPGKRGDGASAAREGGSFGGIFAALAAIMASFAALFGGGAAASAPSGGGGAGAPRRGDGVGAAPQEPAGPSWLDRARSKMLDAFARVLVRTNLARVLGRKHAEYLSKMLQLFDDGDIDAALRHAIPLGEDDPSSDPASPMLFPPTPRAGLDINLFGGMGRAKALGLDDDLFAMLKKRYRAAFEKLDAAGRHKDAAFVLVELLRETAEAVSYLERHGLFTLAAEIAEARKLAPGLVVRQWMLAGDRERAMAIARRHGAFADAVSRLEASHKDAGKALRLLWADSLASAGAYAAAIDVAWNVPEARPTVIRWLDRAIEAGGPAGAKMLAKKLGLDLVPFEEIRDAVQLLIDDDAVDGFATRVAFAQELVTLTPRADTRVLARLLVRRLASERAGSIVEALLTAADDAVLRADLAASGAAKVIASAALPQGEAVVRGDGDRGAIAISDAVLLPGGRVLVALGEAGVRLLAPDGRTIARFLEPAHHLVLSDHGDRAIALAARGKNLWRLARIDLAGRRVQAWRDARFDAFARDFDGATWLVSDGQTVHAIDVLDDAWRALWSSADETSTVTAIARDATKISVLRRMLQKKALETWTVDVAGYVLRKRRVIELDEETTAYDHAIAVDGAVLSSRPSTVDRCSVRMDDGSGWRIVGEWPAAPQRAEPLGLGSSLVVFDERDATRLALMRPSLGVLEVVLEGKVSARRRGEQVLVFDDHGHILLVDPSLRRVVSEWRLA